MMIGQIAIAALSVHSVTKSFGGARVVKDVSLAIKPGEFISLLGPSGCGKTTLLRMIAGLESPDSGTIALGNKDITGIPVWERNIGVVFQNYALFPHMTVAENIGFGLRTRKVPKATAEAKVRDALKLVHLADFGSRSTDKLSGGQKQRVALARALVTDPKLLLLDEPLGALDRKLREQMQVELKMLQREIGITTLMVTHDQEEALTLSDRLAVMSEGRILQDGSPKEIYERPRDAFVAEFTVMPIRSSKSRAASGWRSPTGSFLICRRESRRAATPPYSSGRRSCRLPTRRTHREVRCRERSYTSHIRGL